MPEYKTIKLEGDSLKAAKKFAEMLTRQREEITALSDEFKQRHQFVIDSYIAEGRVLWESIVTPHDIDAEMSWLNGSWRLDSAYLEDHGLVFLNECEPMSTAAHEFVEALTPASVTPDKMN